MLTQASEHSQVLWPFPMPLAMTLSKSGTSDAQAKVAIPSISGVDAVSRPTSWRKPKLEFRARKGTPRVRTGCSVCKIRRVKCDETKPACLKCVSTGRKCEGYQTLPPSSPVSEAKHFPTPAISSLGSSQELRLLYLFRVSTTNASAVLSESSLWLSFIFPAADIYPAVRHSLLALSTLYEAYVIGEHYSHRSQGVLDSPISRRSFVLYNSAVQGLLREMGETQTPPYVVLLCCFLFTWLEILRNDYFTAFDHLRNGLRILQTIQKDEVTRPGGTEIVRSLVRLFTQLQVQATLHGCPRSEFNIVPSNICASESNNSSSQYFRGFQEARFELDRLVVAIYQFIRRKQTLERSIDIELMLHHQWASIVAERDIHLKRLEEWHAKLKASDRSWQEIPILELNFRLAEMQLRNLFLISEMEYDLQIPDFERLVNLAEHILHDILIHAPAVNLQTAVIPSLFYIALKCRNMNLRNRAMAALKQAPEREGVWHRDSMVTAAMWKVSMEESAIDRAQQENCPIALMRTFRERIKDADQAGEPAEVAVEGDVIAYKGRTWKLWGLFSRLGDIL